MIGKYLLIVPFTHNTTLLKGKHFKVFFTMDIFFISFPIILNCFPPNYEAKDVMTKISPL